MQLPNGTDMLCQSSLQIYSVSVGFNVCVYVYV